MTASPLKAFESLFIDVVGHVLRGYGFQFYSGYSRPRGVVLEFVHGHNLLFAAHEGNVIYMDLILFDNVNRFWRVSVNQALWFSGVREVSKNVALEDQLALFALEMPRCCGRILSGDLWSLDSRYCFQLSEVELKEYLIAQRGE